MMKRIYLYLLLAVWLPSLAYAQQYRVPVKPVKNVILMVPDGTSTSVLSLARWYQFYNTGNDKLHLDPYLCGLVKTYSSNSPIPDSAPAMSAYTTGMPTTRGFISLYPRQIPKHDVIEVNPDKAYQPLATVMEAAKIERNKATGVVVTVNYCHATPAACASHHYNRRAYDILGPQMLSNHLDVVFGGGSSGINDRMKELFKQTNTKYIDGDLEAFRNYTEKDKVWALFTPNYFPFDIDRPDSLPSLAEMTDKAISLLKDRPEGFFLMVEGSRVDMAAHAKDPAGIITEFLAFDKAVGVALDFAKKDGETAIVILPDHGTSGINWENFKSYTNRGLGYTFKNISKYKKSTFGLEEILIDTKPEKIKEVFKQYTGINLTDEQYQTLLGSKNYTQGDYTEIGNTVNMASAISKILTDNTYFGFVSGSHTGEDVFLAAYHPQGNLPLGLNTNTDINYYLRDVLGLKTTLEDLSEEIFAKHTDVFAGLTCTIKEGEVPVLEVKKGNKVLTVPAHESVAYLNGKRIDLGSVAVYIDKTQTFYLPKSLAGKL